MKIKDFVVTPNDVTGIILDKIGARRQVNYVMDINGETYEYTSDLLKEKDIDSIPTEVKDKLLALSNLYDRCKEANKEYNRILSHLKDMQEKYQNSILDLYKLSKLISPEDFCDILKKNLRNVVREKLDSRHYEIYVTSDKKEDFFTIHFERRVVVKATDIKKPFTSENIIEHYSKDNVMLFTNINYPSRVKARNFIDSCSQMKTIFCDYTIWQFSKKFLTDNFAELFAKSLRLTPLD